MKNCSSRELKTGHKVAENICKSLSGKGLVPGVYFWKLSKPNKKNPFKKNYQKIWKNTILKTTWMGKKHKRCSTSSAIKEMNSWWGTMRYHYTPVRMTKIQKADHAKY